MGAGIDVKAQGGYILIPPSVTSAPYEFEITPGDTEIAELPEWILSRVNGQKMPAAEHPGAKIVIEQTAIPEPSLAIAISALNALMQERADDYDMWLKVGMSLYELGDDGLNAWDNWSRRSEKYERGACAQKWKTFTRDLTAAYKITFGSLIHWAS